MSELRRSRYAYVQKGDMLSNRLDAAISQKEQGILRRESLTSTHLWLTTTHPVDIEPLGSFSRPVIGWNHSILSRKNNLPPPENHFFIRRRQKSIFVLNMIWAIFYLFSSVWERCGRCGRLLATSSIVTRLTAPSTSSLGSHRCLKHLKLRGIPLSRGRGITLWSPQGTYRTAAAAPHSRIKDIGCWQDGNMI